MKYKQNSVLHVYIIKLLQNEIFKQQTSETSIEPQSENGNGQRQEVNYTQRWNLAKDTRKTRRTGLQQDKQSLEITNRYALLSNFKEPDSGTVVYQQKNGYRRNKDNVNKTRHKILIIGDSHARGMAAKLRHNLDDDYCVQGLVKPGSDLTAILGSDTKEAKGFTKIDVVVVWGSTKDVSINESEKGLTQIRNFVRKNSNTNVMVMNLPNRQDLEATSCVNQEVKVFNRKLCKHMKFFDYASSVEVKFDRDHYNRHGLHLNIKGKEHSAKHFVREEILLCPLWHLHPYSEL